ncbi:hypothetical protein QJQ45_028059 [Haematococcus lacustris]|nr:hypothetical protein QJQ45_028059 [Haematococcus lacustris]
MSATQAPQPADMQSLLQRLANTQDANEVARLLNDAGVLRRTDTTMTDPSGPGGTSVRGANGGQDTEALRKQVAELQAQLQRLERGGEQRPDGGSPGQSNENRARPVGSGGPCGENEANGREEARQGPSGGLVWPSGIEASAKQLFGAVGQHVVKTTVVPPEKWKLDDALHGRDFDAWLMELRAYCCAAQQPLLVGVMTATQGDLKNAVIQLVSNLKAQGKELTDDELVSYLRKATGSSGQNTEEDLMEKLVKGEYQQKGSELMSYNLQFSLLAMRLHKLPEKLLCMYYVHVLRGLRPDLKRDCARTQEGKRWDSVDALMQFARGREVAMRTAKLAASFSPSAAPIAQVTESVDDADEENGTAAVFVRRGRGRGALRGRSELRRGWQRPREEEERRKRPNHGSGSGFGGNSHGGSGSGHGGSGSGHGGSGSGYGGSGASGSGLGGCESMVLFNEGSMCKMLIDTMDAPTVAAAGAELQLPFLFCGRYGGKPCRVMMDTGATHSILSKEWLDKQKNPMLTRHILERPLNLLTANNDTVHIREQFVGPLEIQKSKVGCFAKIMPGMLAGVDLILGADWLSYYDAVLKPKHGVCTLQATNSGKPENLFALRPKHLPGFAAVAEMEKQRCKEAAGVLSAGQTARLLRQGCSSWLMLVQPSDDNGWHTGSLAAAVVGSEGARSAEANPWLVPAAQLEGLLAEFADVFESMPEGLPPDRKVGHTIRLEPGAVPPYRRMYKLSPREDAEVRKQVAELLAKGLIEPSSSPYGAPILFVQKKDGSLRMCIDYRALNKLTVRDRYPLPRIDELFDKLAGKKVFSSLDLQAGYHQIRITEEDVPKTAFLTPVGQFQFKVLCFGLTNAPATFQRVMNTVFKPLINKSVLVYIDDILVMSNSPEEHLVHLREVLQLMREHKLYAKMSKCEFNQPKLVFLGHIVGGDGIAVDPAKVQVVKDWPAPRSVKDLQAFLGLANYFRRFIPNFSAIAAPLTNLTSKEAAAKYNWAVFAGAELAAFNALKEALCSAPVLALPDFTKAFVVCTDASLLGTGGVLMQEGRPIAYTSKKLSPAETRYTTGEQELLAIVRAVREWRCYLDGAVDVTIETDHNPLIYLQTQTTLSRRQTRWMEELSRYKYEIKYKPGVHNVADPISRNPALAHQDTPAGCDNISVAVAVLSPWADGLITVMTTRSQAARLHENAEMERVIAREAAYREGKLAPRDLSSARLQPPARPGAHSGRDNDHRSGYKVLHADLVEARLHARPGAQPGGEEDLVSARLLPNASPGAPKRTTQHADLAEARLHARPRAQPGGEEDLASARLLPNASPGARSSQADHPHEDLASARLLPPARPGAQPGGGEALQRTTPQPTTSKQGEGKPGSDPLTLLQAIRSAYVDDERFNNEAYTSQLHRLEGLWLTENGKVVVPNSKPLRQRVMRTMHDNQAAGHLGVSKTLDQVTRWFDWAGVSEDVRHYVRNCHSCQVNKASSLKPAGKLQPLPIPLRAWDSVSMDLIVKLPASGPQKYDSILVFVDRLTKMVHLVKTWESITAPQYAKLFIEHVFRLHGMPRDVISDRGPQFKNHFWAEVAKLLRVQVNLSSAYHPQTDGQTERMNRVVEEMLRHYIRPDQRDWADHLPLVEFAINNARQESTRFTPFYLNYGYHPRRAELLDLPQKVPRAHDFVLNIRRAVEQARLCLEKAQKRQKVYADGKRRHATFAPGDMVLLSTQNMRGHSAQPGVRKLKPRYVGPFEVQYMVGEAAVKLELPQQWSRFHNVFHVSLVKPYRSDGSSAVPGVSSPPPEQWLDGEPVYTVERVLDHRLVNTGKRKGKDKKSEPKKPRLEFLVKWQGYGDEHNTWEPRSQLTGCQELLRQYAEECNLGADMEEADDQT